MFISVYILCSNVVDKNNFKMSMTYLALSEKDIGLAPGGALRTFCPPA